MYGKRSPDLPPLKLEPGKFYRAFNQTIWCCIKVPAVHGRALCTRVQDIPVACVTTVFTVDGIYLGRDLDGRLDNQYTLMEEVPCSSG